MKCMVCSSAIEKDWLICPKCGMDLSLHDQEPVSQVNLASSTDRVENTSQSFEPISNFDSKILSTRKHSGCLTAFLSLAVVGNALSGFVTWGMIANVSSSMQGIVMLVGLLNMAGVVFAIAIYKWKKWGVYGYFTTLGISMLLNLGFGDAVSAVRGFIPAGLLWYLIQSSWSSMD